MKPLYKDQLPALDREFKKEAAFAGRLSEKPENWPQELSSDLFKQLPFLSDYDVNVNMDKVDAERGFAFGYADVHNKTERPEQEHEEAGLPHIRVPLVVNERMVKPFSVFMDGEKVMPLNEERVREHLFNPSTFDLSTTAPQDPSLVEPLMPPTRSGIGMGGDYKLASADEQLLAALQGTKEKVSFKHISQEQWQAMYNSLEIQKMVQEYGSAAHPAVQNKVYEMATKMYGYHPKPEPPAPQKLQEHHAKLQEKQQKSSQKQQDKAKKMLADGQKLMSNSSKPAKTAAAMGQIQSIRKAGPFVTGRRGAFDYAMDRGRAKDYGHRAAQEIGKLRKAEKVVPKTVAEHLGKAVDVGFGRGLSKGEVLSGQDARKYSREALAKVPPLKKVGSLMMAIAPTLRESDVEAFVAKVASDETIQAGFIRSGIASTLVEAIDKTKRASAEDRLSALAESILPTVVTIQKLPGGDFFVKSANTDAFAPDQAAQGQQMPQQEMAGGIGADQAQAMQPGQTATAVADPVEDTEAPEESAADVVSKFGEYLVQDLMGNQIMGWAFPTTLAWDGNFTESPVALFTNGSAFAIQDSIAGELIGMSSQLPQSPPRGEGCFYEVSRAGVRATAPVTVKSGMTGPDGGEMYACVDMMGNQFSVHMSPELAEPQRISDTEYALPATWTFMALNNQTQLVPDPVQMGKAAAVKLASQKVTLFWNGTFNLDGGCGINKLASSFRHDLDPVSAEFMLGLLGVNGANIKEKLASARKHGSVDLYNLKTITTLGEQYKGVEKTAQALMLRLPNLRRDLIKEAAALEDESTVDKVLALNFINPENLATFVGYLPELEQTSEKLAEMLLSGFLGMSEIPEGAVERSMRNMEEVILALKAVQSTEA
jgi:hypothetical protein